MRAYSMDIRERVIENLEHESMRKTAKRFGVSDYFVYRLKERYRKAGPQALPAATHVLRGRGGRVGVVLLVRVQHVDSHSGRQDSAELHDGSDVESLTMHDEKAS